MDSPEVTVKTTSSLVSAAATAAATSSPVQESPFSSFLRNLSPIDDRGPHVPQGFLGLNSPPGVFTSPRINAIREGGSRKRSRYDLFPTSTDDDGSKKLGGDDAGNSDALVDGVLLADSKSNAENIEPNQPNVYLADQVEGDFRNSNAYELDNNNEKQMEEPLAVNQMDLGEEQACSAFQSNELCYVDLTAKDQDIENVHKGKSDCTPQLLPEPLQIAQSFEESKEEAGALVLHGLVDNTMHDTEANQLQRGGYSRRCLRFAEAQPNAIISSRDAPNLANGATCLNPPGTMAESEDLDSSHADLNTSSRRKIVNLFQPITPIFPPRLGGKSPTISKPLAIGLHLNAIVNALPKDGSGTECGVLENQASLSVSSLISESCSVGHLNMSQPLDNQETPQTERKYNTEHADNFEEFNQLSPKKKRRKSTTSDSDGCKRCNCKKTQCLKLYCDCFAAGLYCAESCSCQGCRNRPEYEDTVLETRQQIESRNPLAFAPKIVQRVTNIPVNNRDEGNQSVPSSAKHKRGCNCKKSMCLKKYCECYQASVGCSDGCRCEGCKNSYGRKEDSTGREEMLHNRADIERLEGMYEKAMVTSKREFVRSEFYDPHLTPVTPALQCSDQGKDAAKSRLVSRRYIPSPDSEPNFPMPYAKTPSPLIISDSDDMVLEGSKDILDGDSCGQGGMDYRNEGMMDQYSSRHDADLCHPIPLPDFSSAAVASSGSSKATDWKNVSRLPLYSRNEDFSASRSLHWRSSPMTPITQIPVNKNTREINDIPEDSTPDILRDSSTTIKPVQVSSPNGKRVSPPQNYVNEPGSSTSAALKGRKFILRAVSSFPPLSPCIEPVSNANSSRSDLQENKE